jgi:hypothetical protein
MVFLVARNVMTDAVPDRASGLDSLKNRHQLGKRRLLDASLDEVWAKVAPIASDGGDGSGPYQASS